MNVFVICCNDSVEAVCQNKYEAEIVLSEIAFKHYQTTEYYHNANHLQGEEYKRGYPNYRKRFHWHVREVPLLPEEE